MNLKRHASVKGKDVWHEAVQECVSRSVWWFDDVARGGLMLL